jgi:hypothetical protein
MAVGGGMKSLRRRQARLNPRRNLIVPRAKLSPTTITVTQKNAKSVRVKD